MVSAIAVVVAVILVVVLVTGVLSSSKKEDGKEESSPASSGEVFSSDIPVISGEDVSIPEGEQGNEGSESGGSATTAPNGKSGGKGTTTSAAGGSGSSGGGATSRNRQTNVDKTRGTLTTYLRLYKAPTEDQAADSVLVCGNCKILETQGAWSRVSLENYGDHEILEGWIQSMFISEYKPYQAYVRDLGGLTDSQAQKLAHLYSFIYSYPIDLFDEMDVLDFNDYFKMAVPDDVEEVVYCYTANGIHSKEEFFAFASNFLTGDALNALKNQYNGGDNPSVGKFENGKLYFAPSHGIGYYEPGYIGFASAGNGEYTVTLTTNHVDALDTLFTETVRVVSENGFYKISNVVK